MLAAKFVETEIKRWLEEARPNLINPLEYLPQFAFHLISAYDEYRREVSKGQPLSADKENPFFQASYSQLFRIE